MTGVDEVLGSQTDGGEGFDGEKGVEAGVIIGKTEDAPD